VSHELKTKGNKVLALRIFRGGSRPRKKKSKESREWREERNGEKRGVEKIGKQLHFFFAKSNDLSF
jgi:hypothetical protein